MTMREQVEELLSGFLEKNKDYTIEVYMINGMTGEIITTLFVTSKRKFKAEEIKYVMEWVSGEVETSNITFPYDEIMDCYVGYLKPDCRKYFDGNIVVAMKNGMKYEFECVGMCG